jgi:hypothetical protein
LERPCSAAIKREEENVTLELEEWTAVLTMGRERRRIPPPVSNHILYQV